MLLRKMLSREWWFTTLLVVLGSAVCARLGIWQFDRLDQRRAFNAQVVSMWEMPSLDLNDDVPDTVTDMEWRAVVVNGEYDFANQIALRNRYYENQSGYNLMTPLHFDRGTVFVDRGWIPADGNSSPEDWHKYDEPGLVTISGQIRLGQEKPTFGGVPDALPVDGGPLWVWNNADIEMIALQMPYPVLKIYIQPDVDGTDTMPPIPFQPEIELTEGPHFGYALQWFTFATILFAGYPFYLRKQE